MIYGSVCSGVEAASLAWEPLGWRPAWFSEVDSFASAVLHYRWPTVPNMGDMTRFREWRHEENRIDLLVGGTPCQSFSVSGLRKGLADPRGNLALVYLAIADKFRPRWLVWENVPGVLSSNGGKDLGAFLGALGELGYGFAYRVLNARHFGVPQSRRRVFVVGHSGGRWQRSAAVLFEEEALFKNFKSCRRRFHPGFFDENNKKAKNGMKIVQLTNNGWMWARIVARDSKAWPTLVASSGKYYFSNAARGGPLLLTKDNLIRKLMPEEEERLQGFPKGHTRIPYDKRDGRWRYIDPAEHDEDEVEAALRNCPDEKRSNAVGNSMPVPVVRRIGERIQAVEEEVRGER